VTWWGVTRLWRDRSMLREVARAGVAAVGILMLAVVPAHTAPRPEAVKAPAVGRAAPPVPKAIEVASAAERRRSRTEHAGLSRAAATALLRETFPGAAASPVFDASSAGLDAKIVRRIDRHRAVVELDDGRRSLLQSTAPLTVATAGGGQAPVARARAARDQLEAGGWKVELSPEEEAGEGHYVEATRSLTWKDLGAAKDEAEELAGRLGADDFGYEYSLPS